jgi:hypothetical protein
MNTCIIYILPLAAVVLFSCTGTVSNKPSWTFAFYLSGNNSLSFEQDKNFSEIIEGNRYLKNPKVVVYFDRKEAPVSLTRHWSGGRVFHVSGNGKDAPAPLPVRPFGQNALSGATISEFFSYIRNNFPSDHYAFFIAGHGQGWFSGTVDGNKISKSKDVFNISEIAKGFSLYKPDILCLELCLMGDIETISQMKNASDYLVLNQSLLSSAGLDHRSLLTDIKDRQPSSTEEMAGVIFDAYIKSFANNQHTPSVSLIKYGPGFDSFLRGFNNALKNNSVRRIICSDETALERLPPWSMYSPDMIDLQSVLTLVNKAEPEITLPASLFLMKHYSVKETLSGISIYFPYTKGSFDLLREEYRRLKFTEDVPEWEYFLEYRNGERKQE